jgi:hypothetical protein
LILHGRELLEEWMNSFKLHRVHWFLLSPGVGH